MQLLKYRFKKFSFLSGRMFMNRMSKYIYIYLYIYIYIYIYIYFIKRDWVRKKK